MRAASSAAAAVALYVHVLPCLCRGADERRTADGASSSVSASPSTPLRALAQAQADAAPTS